MYEQHTATQSWNPEQTDKIEQGSLEGLDLQLELLEKDIEGLAIRIGPILNQYATAEAKLAHPEPSSQIRGRVHRLGELRSRIAEITQRVDL